MKNINKELSKIANLLSIFNIINSLFFSKIISANKNTDPISRGHFIFSQIASKLAF
jgi:hypothetical protein